MKLPAMRWADFFRVNQEKKLGRKFLECFACGKYYPEFLMHSRGMSIPIRRTGKLALIYRGTAKIEYICSNCVNWLVKEMLEKAKITIENDGVKYAEDYLKEPSCSHREHSPWKAPL
ncbi:hypothetical protein [Desulfonatronum lacustre]|uniref:hypothetical protein n=1 Tax=Desulfonatronum lacustre TaxID=66849 RepID=UPI0012EB89F7|nr:hypothetical protein [Desulfonatronum lacustre]